MPRLFTICAEIDADVLGGGTPLLNAVEIGMHPLALFAAFLVEAYLAQQCLRLEE
jgi:hypothetical protein